MAKNQNLPLFNGSCSLESWIDLVILLTGAFGLRCGEALALTYEDICLNASPPKVVITGHTPGARKSPGEVYVRKQHIDLMRNLLKNGVTVQRTRGHKHGKGYSKKISFVQRWAIPKG